MLSRAAIRISRRNRSGPSVAAELRVEDLEGDRPVVLEVVGQVHRGHPAAAELALERVAVGEGGREAPRRSTRASERATPAAQGSRSPRGPRPAATPPPGGDQCRDRTPGRGRRGVRRARAPALLENALHLAPVLRGHALSWNADSPVRHHAGPLSQHLLRRQLPPEPRAHYLPLPFHRGRRDV